MKVDPLDYPSARCDECQSKGNLIRILTWDETLELCHKCAAELAAKIQEVLKDG